MRVLVLGSGAGGGVPQWNCRCPVCTIAWAAPEKVRRRSQTSVAVSRDGSRWVLLDAAPELRDQIIATPPLHPRGPGRGSPIEAVVLTSGEVDHIAGLLTLREGHPFSLHATPETMADIASSSTFDVLRADLVDRRPLALDTPITIAGLRVTPFAVPGKVPLYRESETVTVGEMSGTVIGLEIDDGERRLAYVPGVAFVPPALRERLAAVDLLLLDGTTYTDDELIALGLSTKTAGRMGHMPMTGETGSLHAFGRGSKARKMYIHLNNSNPVLIEDSPERARVVAAGWDVAHDGLEIDL